MQQGTEDDMWIEELWQSTDAQESSEAYAELLPAMIGEISSDFRAVFE